MPRPILRELVFEKLVNDLPQDNSINLVHGMDILSFGPAKILADKTFAKLVLDVNESPDMHARIHNAFRNIPLTTAAMINDRTKNYLRKADLILTTGDTCSEFVNTFANVDAMTYINCRSSSIKIDKKLLRNKLGLTSSQKLIVFSNTVAPSMGAEETVLSLNELPDIYHLCFLGRFFSDEYKNQLMNLVKKNSLKSRVHYVVGSVTDDYIKLMSGGDIGIIPLDPTFGNNEYVAPARAFDMINAELPILFTSNNEMKYINNIFKLGAEIAKLEARSIAIAIRNFLKIPNDKQALIKLEILKAKQFYDQGRYEIKFCNRIKNLYKTLPDNLQATIICNNSVINNTRLPRLLSLYEKIGFQNTVLCINKPKAEILDKFNLQKSEFKSVDIDGEYHNSKFHLKSKASLNWMNKFTKLTVKQVTEKKLKSNINFLLNKDLQSSRYFSTQLIKQNKTFTNNVMQHYGKEKFDYVITHDIFAFPSVEHFIEKYDSAHIFDAIEIPDLNERTSKNYREMPQEFKENFCQIECRSRDTAKLIYTTSNAMAEYLKIRYNREVHSLVNSRLSFNGKPDPFIRQQLNIPQDAILLVANCTYSEETLPFTCIDALHELPKNIYLLFLGNPTSKYFEKRIKKYIETNSLHERVRFHSPIFGDKYLSVLATCDIGLNVFSMKHKQFELIFPNRALDIIAAHIPIISSPVKDLVDFIGLHGTGTILERRFSPRELSESIMYTINLFQINNRLKPKILNQVKFTDAAQSFSWERNLLEFTDKIQNLNKGSRILFAACKRLNSNVRIFRQCKGLNDAGFDVELVGINAQPSVELQAIAPKTRVKIFDSI